jgi:two-component system phosphate regulon sensor histidine kinase PhoR
MGWIAFALALAALLYLSWRTWRSWIAPGRELEQLAADLVAERAPRTFLVGGSSSIRNIAFALEQLALRETDLRARVQEGEFGVQAIFSALTDGLVVTDRERRIQLTNEAFRKTFALEPDIEGLTLLEAVRDATIERLLGEALERGQVQRDEISLQRPPGTERFFEVVAEPMKDQAGATIGTVVLFRDITRQRQTEAMRRDFVANVSHELRTPLSILRGYLETLLEDPKQTPAELMRIFEVMERHSNRLNLLVDDILSLARLEGPGMALDRTTIRTEDFLRGVMHDWEKKFASKKLRADVQIPHEMPALYADEARLQEIIYNLLDNAVKFSPVGGRILVSAAVNREEISLGVSDNGPGIAARDLPRIFERFYRGDRARQRELGGTGLGLSIVKHIAQLHGGSVEAVSELGRGTTVRVKLPLDGVTES